MNIKHKSFKILNIIENIFGIYRNISTFSKVGKTISVILISIELSLCLYIVFINNKINNFKDAYTFSTQFDSILSILLSCYYSKTYVKFLRCLNANDILVDFQNDKIYFKRLASCFKMGLFRLCAYIIIYYQKKLRVIKRLLRIVASRPIKMKTFGGTDINMTLIPACVIVVASYTVILLQFSNIV
ncbi:uncharacterized protein LOC134654746 [Cydia amplana]|uniref:uncharacterized protein LOC134654746 n=1 Tax=Cydia amplana TaxID=1869771 RepID=UPI002FE6057B